MSSTSGPVSFRDDPHPDPQGQAQAAILLVESLLLALLDAGTLTREQVLGAIDSAHEVKAESAALDKEPSEALRKSLVLLRNIRRSIAAHDGTAARRSASSSEPS